MELRSQLNVWNSETVSSHPATASGPDRFQRSSEIQPQRKLDLPARSQSNRTLHRLSQQAERAAGLRLREATAWLERSWGNNTGGRDCRECVIQRRRRDGEVRKVEDVEYLRSELQIRRLSNRESLVENQIELAEVWTTQSISRQVAEGSGKRYRERGA